MKNGPLLSSLQISEPYAKYEEERVTRKKNLDEMIVKCENRFWVMISVISVY